MGMFESFQEMRQKAKVVRYRKRLAENNDAHFEEKRRPGYLRKKRPLRSKIDRALGIGKKGPLSSHHKHNSFRSRLALRCEGIKEAPWFNRSIIALIVLVGIMAGFETDQTNRCSRIRERDENKADDEAERSSVCRDTTVFFFISTIGQVFFVMEAVTKILAEGESPMKYFSDRQVCFIESTPTPAS